MFRRSCSYQDAVSAFEVDLILYLNQKADGEFSHVIGSVRNLLIFVDKVKENFSKLLLL